jgi:dihydroorotase
MFKRIACFGLCILGWGNLWAQEVDLLIRNGHVFDPANNIDTIMDLSVKDGIIEKVTPRIEAKAKTLVDATGL